jgi:aryl-alcohol dehydrogenase-like predicted oxidoreductase
MELRMLGRSGLKVSPLCLGGNVFGWTIDKKRSVAIGASNYTTAQVSTALEASVRLELPRYESLQPEYNLCTRAPFEQELEPLCRKHGLGVIPYSALASGFLTGKYRGEKDFGKSPRGAGMKRYLDARGLRVLAALDMVATKVGTTPAQVALAWLIARPSITAPIARPHLRNSTKSLAPHALSSMQTRSNG